MPCYWPDNEPIVNQASYDKLKDEADRTTRLLCSLMQAEESCGDAQWAFDNVDGLQDWWDEHKRFDQSRLQKELIQSIHDGLSLEQLREISKIINKRKE